MLSKSKFLLCLPTLALLAGCSQAPQHMGMPPAAVQVAPVTIGQLRETSDFLGTVKSRKSVTLSPKIAGHVTQILVNDGQFVAKGAKIMRIDSAMQSAQTAAGTSAADSAESDLESTKATLSALQSTLKSRQANVDFTKLQYDRYVSLQKEGAVSQSELDSWKNNYTGAQAERDATLQQIQAQKMTIQKYDRTHNQALANLQAQKENLKYYEITAPFAGIIGDIPVKVGDYVDSNDELTTLTENHPLEINISIPAEKASAIHKGSHVTLLSSEGKSFGTSDVFFVAPNVDPDSQTVLIKTSYPNTNNELRADQAVKAQILWQSREGISVPTKAVLQTAGKYFVFVAENKEGKLVAIEKEIEVYGIEGNSYQVKSGLKPSDRIVTTGIQRLVDGTPIAAKSEISENH